MCTAIRFTDPDGNLYFGRNLDWAYGYGETITFTPRNHPANTGHRAIMGMAITSDDFPLYFDCANEDGLAIAGLNFPGYAHFPETARPGTTAVAPYEFPLWVCSNFASVDDVERALADVTLVNKGFGSFPVSLLHWIIADATGCIVVESTAEGLQVMRDPADVLANQPGLAWHLENLRSYLNVTPEAPASVNWGDAKLTPYGAGAGMRGLPGDVYSPSRFVRAAYLNAHHAPKTGEQANVARVFRTLGGVAMVEGCAEMNDGANELTIFTSAFSAREGRYYYNTYEQPAYVSAAFTDFDLESTHVQQVAK